MSGHTNGPWRQDVHGRIMAGSALVASAWFPRPMPYANEEREPGESWLDASKRLKPLRDAIESEMDANARLIAAAPAMLAALERIANETAATWVSDVAKEAIAKATGAQP